MLANSLGAFPTQKCPLQGQSHTAGDRGPRGELALSRLKQDGFPNPCLSPLLWEAGFLPEKSLECKECPEPPARAPAQNALEAQGSGGIFPATSGPPGHWGVHTRHHLLALGSGLNGLAAFPGSQAGSDGPPAGASTTVSPPVPAPREPGPGPVLGAEVQRKIRDSALSHLVQKRSIPALGQGLAFLVHPPARPMRWEELHLFLGQGN